MKHKNTDQSRTQQTGWERNLGLKYTNKKGKSSAQKSSYLSDSLQIEVIKVFSKQEEKAGPITSEKCKQFIHERGSKSQS